MNQTAIFWPMIAHVFLVYAMYGVLRIRRTRAVAQGEVRMREFALRGNEPPTSAAAANNILNQFEIPLLFHIVCLCIYVTAGANLLAVVVAWIFALSRFAHAWVHVTNNRITSRFLAFMVGYIALGLLWIWFALHISGLA